MNKWINKKTVYLGLFLGILRILIGITISKFNLDAGYFIDIFIFAYLFLWIMLIKHKISFIYIVLSNAFIVIVAILVHDLYVILFKHPLLSKTFWENRSIIAIYILLVSFISSVCSFLAQQFLLRRKKW
jgi:hypothetical protein